MLKMDLQQFGGRGSSGSGGGSGGQPGSVSSMSRQFDKYEDDTIEQYTLKDKDNLGVITGYKYDDPDWPTQYEWQVSDALGGLAGSTESLSEAMAAVIDANNRRKAARK